eukprot:TRINITY_DN9098_c0_g1_i1.p1 TRINITY_DN9098_c0_g1~~TRINITY_DN9098_c0_g1_i1.p1  ORF type:complete len:172 (+),score=24.15 TRINITY_DN9098_c0_g1_i1:53-568(+)
MGLFNTNATLDQPTTTGMLGQKVQEHLQTRRPWKEFFATREHYSLPNPTLLLTRLKANLLHFHVNYFVIFLVLSAYSIISNPLFLISFIAILALWGYALFIHPTHFTIRNITITNNQRNGILIGITLLLFYMTSAVSTLFWLLGASITVILVHSLLYNPEVNEEKLDFGDI